MDITTTACFTGHRPPAIGGWNPDNPLRAKVREALRVEVHRAIALGYRTFISGMAQGVDQDAAELVLSFRAAKLVEGLRLVAAVPCVEQEKPWPLRAQARYYGLLQLADETVHTSELPYLGSWQMHQRNTWMVERSQLVIAVWNGQNGGTADCFKTAVRFGRDIRHIKPQEL